MSGCGWSSSWELGVWRDERLPGRGDAEDFIGAAQVETLFPGYNPSLGLLQ